MIAELTDFMLGFYGTLHCVELQRLRSWIRNPCHAIVEAGQKLEELLAGRSIYARQMQDRLAPDLGKRNRRS